MAASTDRNPCPIRAAMEAAGFNLTQFAALFGIDDLSTASRYVNGSRHASSDLVRYLGGRALQREYEAWWRRAHRRRANEHRPARETGPEAKGAVP